MQFREVSSYEEAEEIFLSLPRVVSLDTETTGVSSRTDEILRFVISPDGVLAYSFARGCLPLLLSKKFDLVYTQNFKFDWAILYHHGIDLTDTPRIDAMLLHHLIDENAEHDLGSMVKGYYGDDYKAEFWGKYKTYEQAPKAEALAYECKDAIYTYRLCQLLSGMVEPRLIDHVHRLAHSLYLTELRGVRVDQPLMIQTKSEMGGKIDTYLPALRKEFLTECTAWELDKWFSEIEKRKTAKGKTGVPRPVFNFGSTQQVQWLIYDALGAPITRKTKAGAPSTDYDAIESLLGAFPRLKTYHDYIEIKTIFGTFVEGLIERIEEGRIFPSFNVGGTHTGRISHANPNLGNMPKDGPFRNFFLPDEGHLIIDSDYSQLEVVIEANLTGDKNLAKIVLDGASKHDVTMQGLHERGFKWIDRDKAKTLNFALQYWCEAFKVGKILKLCTHKRWDYTAAKKKGSVCCSGMREAEAIFDAYWDVYSGPRDLKMLTDAEVEAGLPIRNLFGRIRHLPAKFDKEWQQAAAQRQAYNFKIQGPGGDFTNLSFARMSERLERNGRGRMLWSVHDQNIGSVKSQYAAEEQEVLNKTMADIGVEYGFKIPLSAKGSGPLERWAKA